MPKTAMEKVIFKMAAISMVAGFKTYAMEKAI